MVKIIKDKAFIKLWRFWTIILEVRFISWQWGGTKDFSEGEQHDYFEEDDEEDVGGKSDAVC